MPVDVAQLADDLRGGDARAGSTHRAARCGRMAAAHARGRVDDPRPDQSPCLLRRSRHAGRDRSRRVPGRARRDGRAGDRCERAHGRDRGAVPQLRRAGLARVVPFGASRDARGFARARPEHTRAVVRARHEHRVVADGSHHGDVGARPGRGRRARRDARRYACASAGRAHLRAHAPEQLCRARASGARRARVRRADRSRRRRVDVG